MRDFRDAKTMAQTLRETLIAKSFTISHSESLELVSKILGVPDWNTLSAVLRAGPREIGASGANRQSQTASHPALPLRDLVPFPNAIYPLFVGREKTKAALDHAFERNREVVLAVQRKEAVDEPGFSDIYEIGVLAGLLELLRLPDGTLKVVVQTHRRVLIRSFVGEAGAFQAEIADVSEGPILEAPEAIQSAVERFKTYAAAREMNMPQIWPALDQIRNPGRVADVIGSHLVLPISDKQGLLATIDPVARLEKVAALMDGAQP
jgi:ATP-dependent Lon protease